MKPIFLKVLLLVVLDQEVKSGHRASPRQEIQSLLKEEIVP